MAAEAPCSWPRSEGAWQGSSVAGQLSGRAAVWQGSCVAGQLGGRANQSESVDSEWIGAGL